MKFEDDRVNLALVYLPTSTDSAAMPHYIVPGGVDVLHNGSLLLIHEIDVNGNVIDGHIYAPGQWKEVSIERLDS